MLFGFLNNKCFGFRCCGRLIRRYAKTITNRKSTRFFFNPDDRSQRRFLDYWIVLAEIDHIALRIITKVIVLVLALPAPWFLDVMQNSFFWYAFVFFTIDRASMSFVFFAGRTRTGTAIRHFQYLCCGSLCNHKNSLRCQVVDLWYAVVLPQSWWV